MAQIILVNHGGLTTSGPHQQAMAEASAIFAHRVPSMTPSAFVQHSFDDSHGFPCCEDRKCKVCQHWRGPEKDQPAQTSTSTKKRPAEAKISKPSRAKRRRRKAPAPMSDQDNEDDDQIDGNAYDQQQALQQRQRERQQVRQQNTRTFMVGGKRIRVTHKVVRQLKHSSRKDSDG